MVLALSLAGCAKPGLYDWGDYEDQLADRYAKEDAAGSELALREQMARYQTGGRRAPPGLYADYGFLLFRRGEDAGAIAYFEKEKQIYPESRALMDKLIEKVRQKSQPKPEPTDAPVVPQEGKP
ncbi:MAG: DUF4810 domain-containing protein [Methylococcaceae bacterium]|nr:DUF4810 domain-containing protein [Methylococcaceae bacterium]